MSNLVLTRKVGQEIHIGDDIELVVDDIQGAWVRVVTQQGNVRQIVLMEPEQTLPFGDSITVKFFCIQRQKWARFGIDAPQHIAITRPDANKQTP